MAWFSGLTELAAREVAAWPPPGPTPSTFEFHHSGSNFSVFMVLFLLCTMEVVLLTIITEEQMHGESQSRSAASLWFEMDDD